MGSQTLLKTIPGTFLLFSILLAYVYLPKTVTNKDTSPFAFEARAPTFRSSSAWCGFVYLADRKTEEIL